MKEKLKVGFITTVSGRWPRELPRERRPKYQKWLSEKYPCYDFVFLEDIVEDKESLEKACKVFQSAGVDVILLLYGAFSGDDYACQLYDSLKKPIIFWALREPDVHGGRLLANALVATTMNNASVKRLGGVTHSVFGNEDEPETVERLSGFLAAYSLKKIFSQVTMGLLGYRPTAFYNSAFNEGLIRKTFGIKMEGTELKVVFDKMGQYSEAEEKEELKTLDVKISENLPKEYLSNHCRLFRAMREVIDANGYDYCTVKCWPEMGAADCKSVPCAVLGRLADTGRYVTCEGDVDAALAYAAENILTGQPCFISDMINIDEKENYMTFWHCGNAAPSLMDRKQFEPVMDDHPLANKGTAFRCILKQGDVTFARFCNIDEKYVLFVGHGTAIPSPMYTPGAMINVKMEKPVKDIVYTMLDKGIPHHYSLVWADVSKELIAYAKMTGMEVIEV